ncbi:MAG: aminoacyl-tRNA hydrolase [Parvibaculaceae bacterium]
MILIAGLGNPGPRYAANRHNIGFMALDEIARRHGLPSWRKRFQGEAVEGVLGSERAVLLKPMTFMNESGRAVGEAMRYLKLEPADVVVLHDELDLVPGKVRAKTGGGAAGHNGLRSITAHIGPDYHRLRLGVGRPQAREAGQYYVLSDFHKLDREWLEPMLDALAEYAPLIAARDFARLQNKVHLKLNPPADAEADGDD